MPCRFCISVCIAVTAHRTGMCGISLFCTGGSCHFLFVTVPRCIDISIFVLVTAVFTSVECVAFFSAGGSDHCFFIIMPCCRYNYPIFRIGYYFLAVVIFIVFSVKVVMVIVFLSRFCAGLCCSLKIVCQFHKGHTAVIIHIFIGIASFSAIYCQVVALQIIQ